MRSSISFPRLYRARRLTAEPRVAVCVQLVQEWEHTVFEADQPVFGSATGFMQRPVQPGSMPSGHGIRSYAERDLARPVRAGMASHSSLQAKGGPIISR
jgi:hypothetical protein